MGVTSELKKYLHSTDFRDELVRKYTRFEILSEAGLRTAVSNLLGMKIRELGLPAEGYRVTCETRLAGGNVVPDILIWKGKHPRICVELKDTRGFIRKKAEDDWQKLQNYCKQYLSVRAAYLIYVARLKGEFPIKRSRQTLRCWPIPISLSPSIPEFQQWEAQYRQRAHYKTPERKAKRLPAQSKVLLP